MRERAGAALLARPHAAIPQIDEGGVARLQRGKAEAIAVVRDGAAIVVFDECVDPVARLPRRPRQPPGEKKVVVGCDLFEYAFVSVPTRDNRRTLYHRS